MVECGVLISRHRLYKCFQCLGRHPKSFQKLYNVCIGPTYRNCLRDIANNQSYAQAESFLMFPILQAECSATWSVYISVPYSCATHHSPLAALPHPNKNAKSWCKRQQVYYSMTCLMFWDSFSKGIKQHIYHTYIIHILYISYSQELLISACSEPSIESHYPESFLSGSPQAGSRAQDTLCQPIFVLKTHFCVQDHVRYISNKYHFGVAPSK